MSNTETINRESVTPAGGCQTADSAIVAGEKSVAAVPASPKRRGGGAPKLNRNHLGPGTHAFINGRWPAGASWVSRQGHQLRKALRAAVVEMDGATSIYAEATINSCVIHDSRRLLLQRWLRLEGDALPLTERAAILDRIGKATDARDNCLKALRLDRRPEQFDPWAELDRQRLVAPEARQHAAEQKDGPDIVQPAAGMPEATPERLAQGGDSAKGEHHVD